ncbi:hypothetical protein [Brevibacillus brevis]|uniref:hypothetical protein n=1 Tax=Brevibacillus brevis TaxID=1393 RepID=UPI000F833910|nr:hypothetical protein [Brevibacillus brevis]
MDYLLRFPSKSGVPLRLPQSVITQAGTELLPSRQMTNRIIGYDYRYISSFIEKRKVGEYLFI